MALLKVGESNRFSASRMSGSSGASVASLAGLALHTAHRFEHPGRAGAYEEGVVVDVQHPKPSLAPSDRRPRPCAVDTGDQASAYAGLQDRHDHALRAGVEGLHDVGRLIPGHPHEGRRPGGGEGLEHGQHLVVTDHAVLRVDADPVIAGAAHQLGRERAGDDAPAADRRLAPLPQLPQRHRLSRAPNLTPLTTLEGSSPSSTRVRLSRTTSKARASDSTVKPPTWGEKNTLSIRRSGLSAGVGSCSKTSSPAPPR